MKNYLNFEKDIKSLENEIEKLQDPFAKDGITQVETGKLAKLQNDLSSKLNEIYSKHTGKTLEEISIALERDNFMTAEQAKDFGLVDQIVEQRPDQE